MPEPTRPTKPTAKKPTAKKPATSTASTKARKATKQPKAQKPAAATKPGAFGPPDWGNVPPPPIEVIPTGKPKVDEALAAVFSGRADAKAEKLAATATDEQLIAMFQGNALVPGRPFHDDKLVNRLTPAQKGQRSKAYWAAESAKNQRERVFLWFCKRLASSPAGRSHLLDIAAGDHAARVRAFAAHALRDSKPDAALWKQIGARLDPASWVGAVGRETSTYLLHVYTVGAVGALVSVPDAAYRRWVPLLEPDAANRSEQSRGQASAIILGVRDYIGEILDNSRQEEGTGRPERDPTPCLPFLPHLLALLDHRHFEHFAMFALERLPSDPRVAAAIAARVGPWNKATYFGDTEMRLLSKSSDPTYLPWLGAALKSSWMHWPAVFDGLANMGDPRGVAIIEAWMTHNDASDRRGPAKRAIAAIRAKGGEPTAAQREEAVAMFAPDKKKRRK